MCIKLYIANLAKYNNGVLDGKWYDLEDYKNVDDFMNDVKREVLHQRDDDDGEPIFEYGISDEEWAIHDYEAPFKVSEYEGIKEIEAMIDFCNLDENEQKIAAYLFDNGNYSTLSDAIKNVDDCIFYPDMTLVDVAYELVEEGCFGEINDSIKNYIDYEAIARDLSYDNYHETSDGVFCCN